MFKRLGWICFIITGAHCAPQGHSGDGSPSMNPILPPPPDAQSAPADSLQKSEPLSEEANTIPEAEDHASGDISPTEPQPALCKSPAIQNPRWWDDSVAYEIFVRSFQDSDGDGTGDLQGLKNRLPYLNGGDSEQSLGVDLIWLMPILESPSYHGYDVVDYNAVDGEYGDLDTLKSFLSGAEEKGVKVVMDFVMNHSSDQHPWFIQSAQDNNSPERDYYTWNAENPGWTQPWGSGGTWHQKVGAWYYGLFSPSMPDLNFLNPEVEEKLTAAAETWLLEGLSGFRLDAVRYLIENGGGQGQKDQEETHAAWARFRTRMDAAGTEPLLVGEAWAEMKIANSYFGTDDAPEMNMVFDFDGATAMLQTVKSNSSNPVRQSWCNRWSNTPENGSWGTFLSNHDQDRVATTLKGEGPEALKTAAALLLLSPGTPWVYYGEEIGAVNGTSWGDMGRREPMHWSDSEQGFTSGDEAWTGTPPTPDSVPVDQQWQQEDSLLKWYQTLIRVRKNQVALRRGSAEFVDVSPDAVSLYRETAQEACIILIPVLDGDQTYTLTHPQITGAWANILNAEDMTITAGSLTIDGAKGNAHILCQSKDSED